MIASEQPPSLASLRPGIPPELVRAVEACLEKDPDKRISLVNLAGVLAHTAPERARPLLERIEATLGMQTTRARVDTSPRDLPVLPLATSVHARSEWPQPQRRRRSPFRLVVLAALAAAGLLGGGLYTRRISIGGVRGRIAGATSAVASAANVVSSAVASSLPAIPLPPPFDEPLAPLDGGEPQEEATSPQPATAAKATPVKPHPVVKPRHLAKPVRHKK
jgi:hypothetical protein